MYRLLFIFCLYLLIKNAEGSKLQINFFDANLNFTIEFYKAVMYQNPNVNFLISPIAAQLSLGLAHFGAKGNTAEELSPQLQKFTNQDLKHLYSSVSSRFKSKSGYKFDLVNTFFISKKYRISKEYLEWAKNPFGSLVQPINFEKVKTTVRNINTWVRQNTDHKVNNILTATDIDEKTTALLLNALYFQGYWLRQFDPKKTQRMSFYKNCEETALVDMMIAKDTFNYYADDELGAQFLEIPFKGHSVSMTIVLPRTKFGLHNLEARIADVLVPKNYEEDIVDVMIPKFRIGYKLNMKSTLLAMNVHTPFQCTADFSGISTSSPPLHLNEVIQKTYVEINEKGATNAKAFSYGALSPRSKGTSFVANYPFLYYFKHKVSGIFFIGRYLFPEK
uniref:Serpin domain-containing protein n=1 Tax=Photinus pyralis TaxID=7054 RepID=A0A1Y1LQK7_PHOPY